MKSDAYLKQLHCKPLHRSMKSAADLRPLHALKRVQRQPDQLLRSLYGHFAYGTCYYGHYIITASPQCKAYNTNQKYCTNKEVLYSEQLQIEKHRQGKDTARAVDNFIILHTTYYTFQARD